MKNDKPIIYLDNCATTIVDEDVLAVYSNYCAINYFNPSAAYEQAYEVRTAIENVRQNLELLCDNSHSFVFTSGGTESNNLAIKGVIKNKSSKIIVTEGEHPSVHMLAKTMQGSGYNVDFAKLSSNGTVNLDDLLSKINDETALISVIHTNNQTGVINDVASIAKAAKKINNKVLVHSDGIQSFGKLDISQIKEALKFVDLYSVSGHKLHAPKGTGGLFVKRGISLFSQIVGAGQEKGLRSGTENVGGILAFGLAAEKAYGQDTADLINRYKQFKAYILENLKSFITQYNFADVQDNILVFSVNGIKAETLVRQMSSQNVLVGNGAACSSKIGVNRVLLAIGIQKNIAQGTLRVSFSKYNSIDEIKHFCDVLKNSLG